MDLPIDPAIGIAVIALFYIALIYVVTKKWAGRDRSREIQKIMGDYNKEMMAATRNNDAKELERLKIREKEFWALQTEMMKLMLKQMVVVLPLGILIIGGWGFHGLVASLYPNFIITLPFGIHIPELMSLRILSPSTYGPRGYFIVLAVFLGMIMEMAITNLGPKLGLAPAATAAPQAAPAPQAKAN